MAEEYNTIDRFGTCRIAAQDETTGASSASKYAQIRVVAVAIVTAGESEEGRPEHRGATTRGTESCWTSSGYDISC